MQVEEVEPPSFWSVNQSLNFWANAAPILSVVFSAPVCLTWGMNQGRAPTQPGEGVANLTQPNSMVKH